MKNKIILQGLLFFTIALTNDSYASSSNINQQHTTTMKNHDMYQTKKHPQAPQTIKLNIHKIEKKGNKKLVTIQLLKIKDDTPVTLNDLKEIHTQKIHLLIIDDSLEDYSHIHPKALSNPGLYEFEWNPKKQGNYRIWADLLPIDTDIQEYVVTDLTFNTKIKSEINRTVLMENTIEGYNFKLSFDNNNLIAGKPTMGKITITDSKGNPVKNLEPVMGAFAHIVRFSDDLKTIVHIHPMGEEPSKLTDRGGPELQFHIEPETVGFIKLFIQVNIEGKELFVPFGIIIK